MSSEKPVRDWKKLSIKTAVDQSRVARMLRFGAFELNTTTGELRKHGRKIRLQGQSLKILLCLLEEPGESRSREELRRKLWGSGTFVDFDHGLNVAVNRLRERLGDSAEAARYIETMGGAGYRFVGLVEAGDSPQPEPEPAENLPRDRNPTTAWLVLAVACPLLLLAFAFFYRDLLPKEAESEDFRIESVAVLPLTILAVDESESYLADGMTEELITELARLGRFRVISRTSIMRYKKTSRSITDIGRELNVDAVVEGTVRRSGDRVRVTVQLVRASPEHHIWADAFEGDIRDVLNLQRDVAGKVANKIRGKLPPPKAATLRANKRLDPETYEDYLRGRHFLARRNAEAMSKAAEYFQRAVHRDPQFAEAFAGLATTYDLLGTFGILPPEECFPQAKDFARKALQLDGTLAEAYAARGHAADFYDLDWSASQQDFQRALVLDPSSAFAHHWYGEHFIAIGKAEWAVSELKRARQLDPLSLPIISTLGRAQIYAHHYGEAVEQCRKVLELEPTFAMGHWCLGLAHTAAREYSMAVAEFERANELGTTPLYVCQLACAHAALGETVHARAMLQILLQKARTTHVSPYFLARIYATLGDKDEAFRWLEMAFDKRDHLAFLPLDFWTDTIRSDPRFLALFRRLHLPA